jgi:hypothetical protein
LDGPATLGRAIFPPLGLAVIDPGLDAMIETLVSSPNLADVLRVDLCAIIVAVTDGTPRILTIESATLDPIASPALRALPWGPLDPRTDRTLERTLRSWVARQSRLALGYVEQLYTFDEGRAGEGLRRISVAYLALIEEQVIPQSGASWLDVYRFFPWEDWRERRPELIDRYLLPGLENWLATLNDPLQAERERERMEIYFGLGGAPWVPERVLERYELLYQAALVPEAGAQPSLPGLSMAFNHRRVLATALSRLRGKIKYRPVVFELLPPRFTLWQLQQVVEALTGMSLHKQNFRRLVEQGGLVASTGEFAYDTGGRPAQLFRFRRRVLRERPAPGVGLAGGFRDS